MSTCGFLDGAHDFPRTKCGSGRLIIDSAACLGVAGFKFWRRSFSAEPDRVTGRTSYVTRSINKWNENKSGQLVSCGSRLTACGARRTWHYKRAARTAQDPTLRSACQNVSPQSTPHVLEGVLPATASTDRRSCGAQTAYQ